MFLLYLYIDSTNTSHFNILFLVIMKLPFFLFLNTMSPHSAKTAGDQGRSSSNFAS